MMITTTFSGSPSLSSPIAHPAASGSAAPAPATPAACSSRRRLSRGPPLLVIEAVLDLDQGLLGQLAHVEERGTDLLRALALALELRPLGLERGLEEVDPRVLAIDRDGDPLVADRLGVDSLLVLDACERRPALVLGGERRRRAGGRSGLVRGRDRDAGVAGRLLLAGRG